MCYTDQERVNMFFEYFKNEDWDNMYWKACRKSPLAIAISMDYLDKMPPDVAYQHIISCYGYLGDGMSQVRKEMRTARKYGSPDLPKDIKEKEWITVYRGGTEPIEKAKYRLSWTTDFEVALWFKDRAINRGGGSVHIYKGVLKTEKIIAYIDNRYEREVVQYRNVRNIEEIHTDQKSILLPSPAEWHLRNDRDWFKKIT